MKKITALLMDAKEFGSGKTFGWDAYERDEGKEMLRQLRQILEKEQIQLYLQEVLPRITSAGG
mgnify:CR=1 FL=1